ncbi:MAG TPA: hypothetical protein VF066_18605 [Thermoleophilaceae bacterium]
MSTDTASTDPLVEVLATRLRVIDLIVWRRVATWAEESELSFEHIRLLLALATKVDGEPATVAELGALAGLALDVAYPATHSVHGRGYLLEENRHYSLTERGHELLASLWAAHREGIVAYTETIDREERERLMGAFGAQG